MRVVEVAIIGAGPAGVSAAIQLKRSGIEVIVFEKEEIGGLLRNANLIENYPGFPEGITGPQLTALLKTHLLTNDIHVDFEPIVNLDYNDDLFSLQTASEIVKSPIVIIASGTQPKKPGGIDIKPEIENKIYYEIFPLLEIENRKFVIIGAGDVAFDYALNLARKNKVIVINRNKRVKCLPLLWERTLKTANISYFNNTLISSLFPAQKSGVIVNCSNPAGSRQLKTDYIIFAIGRIPNLTFLSDRVIEKMSELQANGALYLVGDVKNGSFRQASIAVANGIQTAMTVYKNLTTFPLPMIEKEKKPG